LAKKAPLPPSIPPPLTSSASWPSSSVVHSADCWSKVELGDAFGDPVEELEAIGVALVHGSHRDHDSGDGVGGDKPFLPLVHVSP
jgi:hypothetical protein